MSCELLLATALLAPGQPAPNAAGDRPNEVASGTAGARSAVYEQIEVMRALLIRKLGRSVGATPATQPLAVFGDSYQNPPVVNEAYPGGPGMTMATTPYRNIATSFVPAVEGAYLDGYGVVFTAICPATNRDPRPGASESKDLPALTDWDREQRRLRGEPPPDKSTAPKTAPIGDVLLNLLAENGKHFTALKEEERVTIAVTFRGSHQGLPIVTTRDQKYWAGGAASIRGFDVNGGTATGAPAPSNPDPRTAVREDRVAALEALGQLHLKQGEPQLAIDALRRAVETAESEVKQNPSGGNEQLRGALMKLSQALLAAGRLDEARETMDRASTGRLKAVQAGNPPPKVPVGYPARLTISAPKKLLDQIGNGKISMDEFRKQASVEYVPAG
jgi:hypothetical protein